VLYVLCALALVGLGLYVARRLRVWRGREDAGKPVADGRGEASLLSYLALCAAAVVGTLGAINYYSWRARGVGGGIQGRYYLGAIVPLVVLLAVGLLDLLPARWRPLGHWLLCWGMILLNGLALFQVVLPRYYL
jgi:hypothetical protein